MYTDDDQFSQEISLKTYFQPTLFNLPKSNGSKQLTYSCHMALSTFLCYVTPLQQHRNAHLHRTLSSVGI